MTRPSSKLAGRSLMSRLAPAFRTHEVGGYILLRYYTCDKQVLWENAGTFFPRDNSLVSARKSHSSGVRGLVVRCLPFNPEGSGSNPCVCANFFYKYSEAECFLFFSALRLHPFSSL